jgi:hypothetical protein
MRADRTSALALRVRRLIREHDEVFVETARAGGKLRLRQALALEPEQTSWIGLAADSQDALGPAAAGESADGKDGEDGAAGLRLPLAKRCRIYRWTPPPDRAFGQAEARRLLEGLKEELGVVRLAEAEFILDVGFGVGNRDGYEAVIEPLEEALRQLGVSRLAVGGSRKVTEELHLLPADRQIGQSGVSVQPRVLLAIGISGAPQHVNYIGPRATILAFNRDVEAPLMTLNQRQVRPRVFPVVGDLFVTVPAFIAALREELARQPTDEVGAGSREGV